MVDIAESFGEDHANGVLSTMKTELLDEIMTQVNTLIGLNVDADEQSTEIVAACSTIGMRAFIAGVTWAGEEETGDEISEDDRIYISNRAAQALLNDILER